METVYPIYNQNTSVGKVQLLPRGLYLEVFANAELPMDDIYRLRVSWQGGSRMLGVLAPDNGGLTLKTHIPAKYIPDTALLFDTVGKKNTKQVPDGNPTESTQSAREEGTEAGQEHADAAQEALPAEETENTPPGKYKFVPIAPEEPFAYIAKLKDAFLATQNGQTGVMIPE